MHKTLLYHESVTATPMDQADMYNEARRKGEVVHSGHFMISSVADNEEDQEDIDLDRDSPVHHDQHHYMIKYGGYDFSNVTKETKDTYQFGPLPSKQITIDASLARLFQCMSLAYQGGKVVSPKWKNFKGLKLTVKDKIRLNNAIWRMWHIQYVMRKKKHDSLIQFTTPLDLDVNAHAKPEAVVMEGKYWKRRIETVVAEYKKWRAFFMEKLKLSECPGLMWVTETTTSPSKDSTDLDKVRANDETLGNDFTDTLFSSLSQQPFHFPNPREIAMHATNSDMMQPGLLQLQPSMDDMEFDAFQELFNPPKKQLMSFTGTPSQGATDFFPISDFTAAPDDATLVAQSPVRVLPTSSSQQSMEFVSNFGDVSRQDVPLLQDPISSSDPIFSSVVVPSNFYQNGMQHGHQQSDRPQHISPLSNNHVPQPQLHHIDPKFFTRELPTQQTTATPSSVCNVESTFMPIQNNLNTTMNGATVQLPYYRHSKQVNNTTANKITYSHTQTSQPLDYFPQNPQQKQVPLVVDQNNLTSILQVDRIQPVQATPHSQSASRHRNRPIEFSSLPQQNQSANNIIVTASNPILLKQLLVNKMAPSSQPLPLQQSQNNRKRISSSNSTTARQSRQNQQLPILSMQETAKQGYTVSIAPAHPQKQVTNIVADKRRNVLDPGPLMDSKSVDVWPQKRRASSSSTSPVKAILQDIDMESIPPLDSVSSITQDDENLQMETIHKQSFSTEQKRRFNIKVAFARLQKFLPGCSAQSNSKISKATMLNKTAQYIKSIQNERAKINDEMESLKRDLDQLHQAINATQLELPATGAPAPRPRAEEAAYRFHAWTRHRTRQEWKFSLFAMVIRPWFESYQSSVSVAGSQEFYQALMFWLEDQCSLRVLRPNVVRSLQVISTSTSILTNPSQLRQQIEASVKDDAAEAGRSSVS